MRMMSRLDVIRETLLDALNGEDHSEEYPILPVLNVGGFDEAAAHKQELNRQSAAKNRSQTKRRAALTAIAEAHRDLLKTLPNVSHGEELERCWACGAWCSVDGDSTLFKAHLVGRANGGSNDVTNLVLLCEVCHHAQPDGLDADAQLAWLRSRPSHAALLIEEYREVVNAVVEHAAKVGAEDLRAEFVALPRDEALARIAAATGKACGFQNQRANRRWAVLAAFKDFIVERAQQ